MGFKICNRSKLKDRQQSSVLGECRGYTQIATNNDNLCIIIVRCICVYPLVCCSRYVSKMAAGAQATMKKMGKKRQRDKKKFVVTDTDDDAEATRQKERNISFQNLLADLKNNIGRMRRFIGENQNDKTVKDHEEKNGNMTDNE